MVAVWNPSWIAVAHATFFTVEYAAATATVFGKTVRILDCYIVSPSAVKTAVDHITGGLSV